MINLEDKVAKLCLDKYDSLKKTGKPTETEWTVLSGVVLQSSSQELNVVSLCTGTKCLSGAELKNTKYKEHGNRLSDSHAEILARRAFLRYLYNQIELTLDDKNSDIFFITNGRIKLKDVSFHFFSSQTPCGDCSIIPKQKEPADLEISRKKIKLEYSDSLDFIVGLEIIDIHRTGAKCIKNDERQDPHKDGVHYHTVGPLRTKPGRGDRTLSLSCSDKIAKWNLLGVQGALLSLMIPSIKFESIVIGGDCPYLLESMQRGLCKRFSPDQTAPIIKQSKLAFAHKKGKLRIRPCPSSIVWCAVSEQPIEIAVDGYKQGATKKKKKNCSLLASRKEIFKTFLRVYNKYIYDKKIPQHPKKAMYHHYKQYSTTYQNLWKDVRTKIIPTWPVKPLYLQECISFL
ncbi:tRNA-specific adenosine deaminase 1 [Copidosoma floridanum]|uniref:tRNA-specific adenosine deaminase 1 n=1 Tax=Copidosoma floridanum TaxID=29053 RepID=UPI0006C941C9|nr:tRNA-specific adenosine deaminase 1 [Copidosoma floridanum]